MSDKQSDKFDRLIGALDGLPDVVTSKPSTVRALTPLVGDAETFIVQTYRQKDQGDTIFIECVSANGSLRIVIPPKIAELIARQRDAVADKARRKAARAAAQDRLDRGIQPAFLKKKESA